MTTLGYGDKIPKTFAARLFGVVWIFTGMTICVILSARITTSTIKANNPEVKSRYFFVGIISVGIYSWTLILTCHENITLCCNVLRFNGIFCWQKFMKMSQKDGK